MSRIQHKRGRKSNYARSLSQNEYWQGVRKIILARDRSCRVCGSMLYLEVHHDRYYVDGVSIIGNEKEHLKELILLCAECHKKHHSKK